MKDLEALITQHTVEGVTDFTKIEDIINKEINGVAAREKKAAQESIIKQYGFENEEALKAELSRVAKLESEYNALNDEHTNLKNEGIKQGRIAKLEKLGVDKDFLEFALNKIPEGEDFEASAKAFVESNPKILAETFTKVNSSVNLNGSGPIKVPTDAAEYLKFRQSYEADGTPKIKK